jgi:hypothetical protein
MPFRETGSVSFLVSLVLPLAVYVIGWVVPALGFASDATTLFIGFSLLLAALRGSGGCEFLALSNWLLHRHDQMACAVFTPSITGSSDTLLFERRGEQSERERSRAMTSMLKGDMTIEVMGCSMVCQHCWAMMGWSYTVMSLDEQGPIKERRKGHL